MPVPKRKTSKSRRDMRSANKHLIPQSFDVCHQEGCGYPALPHRVCEGCGFYKGVSVLSRKKNAQAKSQETAPVS